jgi:hypothetical protein
MKKTDLITLLIISTVLITLSVTLLYFSSHFPSMSSVEHAQQVHELSITHPKSLSAEERTTLIGLMLKSEHVRQKTWDSIFDAAKAIGLLLLLMSIGIIFTAIRAYKRMK